jgi:Flp pilus assembly protein TadD
MRRRVLRVLVVVAMVAAGTWLAAGDAYLARRANDRGKACSAAKQTDCAIREFSTAVRLQPNSPRYHFNLGSALANASLFDQAAMEFRETLRLQPDYPRASVYLTRVQTRIQERGAAVVADELHARSAF